MTESHFFQELNIILILVGGLGGTLGGIIVFQVAKRLNLIDLRQDRFSKKMELIKKDLKKEFREDLLKIENQSNKVFNLIDNLRITQIKILAKLDSIGINVSNGRWKSDG